VGLLDDLSTVVSWPRNSKRLAISKGHSRAAAGGGGDGLPLALETSAPGVLAVGDVRSGSIKRVASAVVEGSMAVRLVHEYLAEV
jgi:thioredoxin reductase